MTAARISKTEFIRLFELLGAEKLAKQLNVAVSTVYHRRRRLEKEVGHPILAPSDRPNTTRVSPEHAPRINIALQNGTILIGSDSHYWPGESTTAHRAFVKLAKEIKPDILIKNGDELDGATISRHPPINWETTPSLIQEIETVQERLHEIVMASPKSRRIWPLGNHDARFETKLAMQAPEYAKIHGVHLKDHFPEWDACYSVFVNSDLVVKHRFKGGIHAAHNNTLWAGRTMVTGHLHSLKVYPLTDYNGTRWGVDCGTLADPEGPQFLYREDNPSNWRSGFVLLTVSGGKLTIWPEIIHVLDATRYTFRGKIYEV